MLKSVHGGLQVPYTMSQSTPVELYNRQTCLCCQFDQFDHLQQFACSISELITILWGADTFCPGSWCSLIHVSFVSAWYMAW